MHGLGSHRLSANTPFNAACFVDHHPGDLANFLTFDRNQGVGQLGDDLFLLPR